MITLEKVYLLNSGPIFVSVASLKKKMLYLQLNTKMNVVIYYGHPYTYQGCNKGQKSGGAGSTVVDIISPPWLR